MRFVNCNGKRLQGLADRRSAEVALWRTGEPGTEADNPPSSFTRAEETPPVEAPKPAGAKLTAISAGAITTLAAVQTGAQQVQGMVAPQADKSPWLGKLLSLTAVLIVAAGVAILALHWLQSKAAKR